MTTPASSQSPIGIIGAMDSELAFLTASLTHATSTPLRGLVFHQGNLGDCPVVLVKCGIGKVNAARCTQILIDHFSPLAIINTGIAGGIRPGLHIGDVVIAEGLIQHDFDVTAFGHAKGYLCTGENDQAPTVFQANGMLIESLENAVIRTLGREKVHRGLIVTGDQFISGERNKSILFQQFQATAAEMEGGAIAQVAALSSVPFAVVRTISDLADGTATNSYTAFEEHAAQASAQTVLDALAHLAPLRDHLTRNED